jgi:2-desacetyl-2-hydroxyethyl bacteriochlorophyllide A dehydrogenase
MKAAVFVAPFEIDVREVSTPVPGPSQALVRVEACGICGTDLHIQSGGYYASYPIIPGHEFSGVIEAVGESVSSVSVGAKVTVNPNNPCRVCDFCRVGRFHLCRNSTACGVTYNGAFAEFCLVEAQLAIPVSDALPLELWAMMEPTSCCLHGIDLAGIRPGDRVAILGGGSIGLILMQLARSAGAAQVIVSEPQPAKRALAGSLGADVTLDPSEVGESLPGVVRDLTDGGADVVIEAAGIAATANVALSLARRGGTVLFFGVCPQDLEVPIKPYDVFHNELTIRGTFTNPLTDTRALALLASGRVKVEPLISHRYALNDIAEGLAAVRRGETVKAMVRTGRE